MQKNLREGHCQLRTGYQEHKDHKKYVKDKIEQLKTRNSGIFYENGVRKF